MFPLMRTEKECAALVRLLYPDELAAHPGYELELTIIYTDGKRILWEGFVKTGSSAAGVMTGAYVDAKRKKLVAAVLMDVSQFRGKQSASTVAFSTRGKNDLMRSNSLSKAAMQQEFIKTFAHEIYHAIQSWRSGATLDGDDIKSPELVRYSKEYNRLLRKFRRDHPNAAESWLHSQAHARSSAEREAQDMAASKIGKHRIELQSPRWEVCFPIKEMNAAAR